MQLAENVHIHASPAFCIHSAKQKKCLAVDHFVYPRHVNRTVLHLQKEK